MNNVINQSGKDKSSERYRYDSRARQQLAVCLSEGEEERLGSEQVAIPLRTPYLAYERYIREFASENLRILEIGAGSGIHTLVLLMSGAVVTATDISEESLDLLKFRYKRFSDRLFIKTADMEALPFESGSFDLVCSAGSLSYGDNQVVRDEIARVLAPDGVFICVDSLNNNPVYRFNRWLHYRRGNRSLSTLKRLPSLALVESYRELFQLEKLEFFGAISLMVPVLRLFLSDKKIQQILDGFDALIATRRLAFKFTMLVRKK